MRPRYSLIVSRRSTDASATCAAARTPRIGLDEAAVGVGAGQALQRGQHVAPRAAAEATRSAFSRTCRIVGRRSGSSAAAASSSLRTSASCLAGRAPPRAAAATPRSGRCCSSRAAASRCAAIGGEEPQRGERRADRIAHPVVDRDRRRLGIRLRHRRTGRWHRAMRRRRPGSRPRRRRRPPARRPRSARRICADCSSACAGQQLDGAVAVLGLAAGEQLERLVDAHRRRRRRARLAQPAPAAARPAATRGPAAGEQTARQHRSGRQPARQQRSKQTGRDHRAMPDVHRRRSSPRPLGILLRCSACPRCRR